MRGETSDGQISDFRQVMRLEPFHPLSADHMVVGDFSTPLEMTGRRVPQCYSLLPGEGACVTFYTLESLERGGMVVGDFSTSLEMTVRHVP